MRGTVNGSPAYKCRTKPITCESANLLDLLSKRGCTAYGPLSLFRMSLVHAYAKRSPLFGVRRDQVCRASVHCSFAFHTPLHWNASAEFQRVDPPGSEFLQAATPTAASCRRLEKFRPFQNFFDPNPLCASSGPYVRLSKSIRMALRNLERLTQHPAQVERPQKAPHSDSAASRRLRMPAVRQSAGRHGSLTT